MTLCLFGISTFADMRDSLTATDFQYVCILPSETCK